MMLSIFRSVPDAISIIFALSSITSIATASAFPTSHSKQVAPYCPPRPVNAATQAVIFDEFIDKFLIQKNSTLALLDHMDESYIQHNPNVLSGRQVAIDGLAGFGNFVNYTIANKAISGSRGFVHYRLDIMGVPLDQFSAVVDVFRFDGTCMMEHWDVIQQRPVNATNPLAMF